MAEDVIDSTENMKLTADDVEVTAISDEGRLEQWQRHVQVRVFPGTP